MTAAHLPLFRSLSVLVEQADRDSLRQLVEAICADVQEGQPLSEALAKHPKQFPDLYVNMVRAGESSGHLETILERLADFLEKTQKRRSQVLSAFMYPAVLICVAIGAVVFMMGHLIPKLQEVFAEMQQSLPLITQVVMAIRGGGQDLVDARGGLSRRRSRAAAVCAHGARTGEGGPDAAARAAAGSGVA